MKLLATILYLPLLANAADQRVVNKIIACESSHRAHIYGDGGRAYGLAQFHLRTFNEMKRKAGLPRLNWKRPSDQIILLHWALDNGYGYKWTCYRKLVERGEIVLD